MTATAKKRARRSVSISGKTYGRLRHTVQGSIPAFVDGIVLTMLEDETILSRVTARCLARQGLTP
jgi:hypothetical protein